MSEREQRNLKLLQDLFSKNAKKSGFQILDGGELRIISDNSHVVEALRRQLDKQGFEIIPESKNPLEPIAKWKRGKFGEDGKELCYYSIAVKHDDKDTQKRLEDLLTQLKENQTLTNINSAPKKLVNQPKSEAEILQAVRRGENPTDADRKKFFEELIRDNLPARNESTLSAKPVHEDLLDSELPALPKFTVPKQPEPRVKETSYLGAVVTAVVLAITSFGGGMLGLRQLANSKEVESKVVVREDDFIADIREKLKENYKNITGVKEKFDPVKMDKAVRAIISHIKGGAGGEEGLLLTGDERTAMLATLRDVQEGVRYTPTTRSR